MTVEPGVRVRVRLLSEPDLLDANKGAALGCTYRYLASPIIGHTMEQDGRVGTVRECSGGFPCKFGSVIGHGIMVMYDAGYAFGGAERWGGHYAENELELA